MNIAMITYRNRELDDDLSDLLEDNCRMTDSAALAVGLRCKRSPRRSTSAKELLSSSSSKSAVAIQQSGISKLGSLDSGLGNSITSIEKQKCFPIFLSGVIDSIDSNHTVRYVNI